MKKIRILLASIFYIFSNNSYATTLLEALAHTYETNPNLALEREKLKKTDEQIYNAISGFLPSVHYEAKESNIKSDTKWINNKLSKQDGWSNVKTKKTSINLEQNLFNGGKTVMAIKMAEYTIKSERESLLFKEQEILLEAINAYLNIISSRHKLEINKENVQDYTKRYYNIKEKFDAGFSKQADLATALSRKSDAETNLAQASGEYISNMAIYFHITGLEANNTIEEKNLCNVPSSQIELLQNSLKENPELLSVIYKQKAANLNIKYNLSSMLPSIDLGASLSKLKEGEDRPYANVRSVYVSVKVPIYNKGVEYSNVRSSKADAAKIKYELKNTKSILSQKSTQLWNDFIVAREIIRSSEESVKSGTIALESKQKEFNEGLASLSEVLDLQENLFKYKLKLTEAKKNLNLKIYNINALMGKLTVKELGVPTKIYDYKENYNHIKYKAIGF